MNLVSLKSIDSTNKYAQFLLEQGLAADGTVVLALEQTAGKGQRGKVWVSDSGDGIYASFVFVPPFSEASNQFILNKAIAVGVADYIQRLTDEDISVKWPNDIMANGKKVAGLLIENSLRGNKILAVIAGVGVNLNQNSFEGNFETPPISIRMLTKKQYNPETEINSLNECVRNQFDIFIKGDYLEIDAAYQKLLYKRNHPAAFIRGDGVFTGTLETVDNEGFALINEDGNIIRSNHPETRFYFGGGLNE
jgi:BirA family biotin operon repressor/biotin-[acetyl-CoA-carboxylase] ligase